jgi:hypothetical protein
MVKSITELFRPVHIDFGKIHITGGYIKKGMPVRSRSEADHNGNDITFVQISTRERWLTEATAKNRRISLLPTSLLKVLHDKINKMCDGAESVRISADYDPMNEVVKDNADKNATSPDVRRTGGRRIRYAKNHAYKTVVMVDMPIRCPEEDGDCREMRTVTLYIENRVSVWISVSDVEWAIKYMFVQNYHQGGPPVSDDDADVSSSDLIAMHPPSPEVPASA